MSKLFFSECKLHYTRRKVHIKCNKKRSFYRDEFVCPVLLKPEVINCDGSRMVLGSEGRKNKRELGNKSKFSKQKAWETHLHQAFSSCLGAGAILIRRRRKLLTPAFLQLLESTHCSQTHKGDEPKACCLWTSDYENGINHENVAAGICYLLPCIHLAAKIPVPQFYQQTCSRIAELQAASWKKNNHFYLSSFKFLQQKPVPVWPRNRFASHGQTSIIPD